MTYFVIFAILVVFAFAELSNLWNIQKRRLYWCSFLLLMLMAGLRFETGGDWTSYTEIFDTTESIDLVISGKGELFNWLNIEYGYKVLNSFCKFIVNDVQLLFFVVSVIISTLLFRTIPVYSPLPQLSVLVYFGILFFSLDMIVIRQGVAVAICFYGYRYILERRFRKLFFCVCIAALFHSSSYVILPIYFLANREYNNRLLITLFVIFNFILVLQIRWMSPIISFFLNFIVDPILSGQILNYLTNDVYSTGRGITLGLLINIIIFSLFILNRNRMKKYKYFNLFLNIFMIYVFVYCCMSELVEVGNRLKYYFMISIIVILPMLVDSYRVLNNRLILYLGICGFSFMYCKGILLESPMSAAFNPYQNYIIHSITNSVSDGRERLEKSDEEFRKVRGQ